MNIPAPSPRRALAGGAACLALLCAQASPAAAAVVVANHQVMCKPATAAAASAAPREAPTIRLALAAVCLVNHQRRVRGLPRLRLNNRLSKAAKWHTHDMVRRRYFDHVSRSGRDVVDRLRGSGYLSRPSRWIVGENLAWGAGARGTPLRIVRAWMKSPAHRRNMLDTRFREIGIGVIAAGPTRTDVPAATYTTTFGMRR